MLEELRQKPKSVREHYALWSALGVTGIIALVWFVAFVSQFKNGSEIINKSANEQTAGAFSQFFSDMKSDFKNAWPKSTSTSTSDISATATTTDDAFSTSTLSATSSQTSSNRPVLIATSSAKMIEISTSSEVAP